MSDSNKKVSANRKPRKSAKNETSQEVVKTDVKVDVKSVEQVVKADTNEVKVTVNDGKKVVENVNSSETNEITSTVEDSDKTKRGGKRTKAVTPVDSVTNTPVPTQTANSSVTTTVETVSSETQGKLMSNTSSEQKLDETKNQKSETGVSTTNTSPPQQTGGEKKKRVPKVAKKVGDTTLADADTTGRAKQKPSRYFKCFYNNKIYGRLCGNKPKQAANKAFTSLLKHMKKHGQQYEGQSINFSIIECTRGRKKHGHYCYVGKRELLDKPVAVPIKDKDENGNDIQKQIIYRHKNKVNKVKKSMVKTEGLEIKPKKKDKKLKSKSKSKAKSKAKDKKKLRNKNRKSRTVRRFVRSSRRVNKKKKSGVKRTTTTKKPKVVRKKPTVVVAVQETPVVVATPAPAPQAQASA